MLSSAVVLVTTECNFSCEYCFFRHRTGKPMSMCTAKEAAEFLKLHLEKGGTCFFFGGEPLLRREIIEVFVKELKHRARFGVTTNGSIADEETLRFLRENRFGVLLSYDGELGSKRGRLSRENLLKFRELNPEIAVQVHPDNVEFLSRNIFEISELGFRDIAINVVVDSYKPWDEKSLRILQREMDKVVQLPVRLSIEKFSDTIARLCTTPRVCGAASERSIAISPEGKLHPCQRLLSIDAGDIYSGIDTTAFSSLKEVPACRRCDVEHCAPCYASNLASSGNLHRLSRAYCTAIRIMKRAVLASRV